MPNIIRVGGGGGSGLELAVVGGTARPENPDNNTLWLNTETEIKNVYLSPVMPPEESSTKNLICWPYAAAAENVVYNEDGSVTVPAGTSTYIKAHTVFLPAGDYTLTGTAAYLMMEGGTMTERYGNIYVYGSETKTDTVDETILLAELNGSRQYGVSFSTDKDYWVAVKLELPADWADIGGETGTFEPQIEKGIGWTDFVKGTAVGNVWINTSNRYQSDATAIASTTHLLEVKKDPFLRINVLQFNQWDGDEWVRCDGGIYANNEWTDMALYIYWYGTQNEAYPFIGTRDDAKTTAGSIDNTNYTDEYFAVPAVSNDEYGAIYTQAGRSINAEEFTTLGVRVYLSTAATAASGRNFNVGFSSDIDSENLSYNAATNAQTVTLRVAAESEWEEFSVPIVASGIVRPGIAFGYGNVETTLSVAYWVLT